MAIKQISIYLENKTGTISDIANLLSENDINMFSMCIADTKDFGILRIVASDTEKAAEIIKNAGHTFNVREIVCFSIPDKTGSLANVLRIFKDNDINIEYMYALPNNVVGSAFIAARVNDNDKTEEILKEKGIDVLNAL